MNFVILFVRKLAVFEEKYKIKSPETLRFQDFFGRSVIIGFQKTQIYQRFAGSRQEVFILIYGSHISGNIAAANLLLNFTAEWGILCLKGADRYAEH